MRTYQTAGTPGSLHMFNAMPSEAAVAVIPDRPAGGTGRDGTGLPPSSGWRTAEKRCAAIQERHGQPNE